VRPAFVYEIAGGEVHTCVMSGWEFPMVAEKLLFLLYIPNERLKCIMLLLDERQ
jgi:hypothetical protein